MEINSKIMLKMTKLKISKSPEERTTAQRFYCISNVLTSLGLFQSWWQSTVGLFHSIYFDLSL